MTEENSFKSIISKISNKEMLKKQEIDNAFNSIMSGLATDAQIGAFLMGLSLSGETSEIIASGASILRKNAIRIKSNSDTIDTVGTGGDGAHTLNISHTPTTHAHTIPHTTPGEYRT